MVKRKKKINGIKNIEDPIIVAIAEGNLEVVQDIINKVGLNFAETWLDGYTLLCKAIKFHRGQVALWLLSKGCRINRINEDDISDSPLHLAIYNNEMTIVKELINKGACISVQNYKGETPLHISCQRRNIIITELLLKDDSIADIPDVFLSTPLHIAIENECLDTIQLLLNHKVNVNAYTVKDDFKGFTPLHIAILKRNENIIKLLLENGADVNATIAISHINGFKDRPILHSIDYQDYKPLHLATEIDDENIMKLLMNYGTDVNAIVEHNGMTPLHIAVKTKSIRNVILLSEWNANFKAETKDGKNVLHLAVENNWPKLIEVLLLKDADINIQSVNGETPLYIAVEMGDENIVELLLEYNADVNIKNLECQSPLHIAAEFSAEIVKVLLERGAYVDEIDNNNETPLSIAIKQGDLEIITEILQHKPSVCNSINKSAFDFAIMNNDCFYVKVVDLLLEYGFRITDDIDNTNLFHNSVSKGNIKIVKYLLEQGVDISFENQNKNLLLHNAVLYENIEIAELLIKYKCNMNTTDDHGQTPVGYAIEKNNLNMLELLLTSGAEMKNITYPLLTAAKDSNVLLIQLLLKYGADINVDDEFGTTALHFAAWNKHNTFVQFLLSKNAYVNTTEISMSKVSANDVEDEETDSYTKEFRRRVFTSPLHIAVSKKNKDICVTLLEHHANINSKDGYGRTALHIASAMKSTEQKNIIKTLMSYGANINALDDFKRLPIYYIYNQTCVCSIAFQNQYELYSECECDLYEDYDIMNDVIEVFVKYIALLASMNKPVHVDNLRIISKSDFSERLQISCLFEIAKLKHNKIGNCLTFYDVLIKSSNALVANARNENIIQAFETGDYKTNFPLYCDMLKEKFDTARTREYLLEIAALSFNSLLKFKLPEIIAEKIFESLHLNDLKNLSMASEDHVKNNINLAKKLKVH